MADDQSEPVKPEAKAPAPRKHRATKKKDPQDQFSEDMAKLVERARDDGVNTLRVMAGLLTSQARATIDGYLSALEGDDDKQKRKKK